MPQDATERRRLFTPHNSLHGNNDPGGQTARFFGQNGKIGKGNKRPRLIGRLGVRHEGSGIRINRPQRPFNRFANRIQHLLRRFLKRPFKVRLFAFGGVKVDRCNLT